MILEIDLIEKIKGTKIIIDNIIKYIINNNNKRSFNKNEIINDQVKNKMIQIIFKYFRIINLMYL